MQRRAPERQKRTGCRGIMPLRLSINPLGGVGGPQPSDCNPNPATCAVGSEALRSKVSLQGSPAAPKAQVNPVSAEKIAQRAFSTACAPARLGWRCGSLRIYLVYRRPFSQRRAHSLMPFYSRIFSSSHFISFMVFSVLPPLARMLITLPCGANP